MDTCKLCGSDCQESSASSPLELLYWVVCPRCGEYEITDMAKDACPEEFVKEHLHFFVFGRTSFMDS